MTKTTPVIWALMDDRAGNRNQVLGLSEALNLPYIQKNIRYTKLGRLPNIIRAASLLGVTDETKQELIQPWPNLVIAAGRKTTPIARYIKNHSPHPTRIIQLMDPGFPRGNIDLIIVPEHDGKKTNSQIITSCGALHHVRQSTLDAAAIHWKERFSAYPSPRIGVLVGGDTKKGVFTPEMAKTLGEQLSQAATTLHGSLLVTVSRRTSEASAQALQEQLNVPHFFFDPRSDQENPYMGILASSDILVISGDSISMCSEGCATGKPVYIYAPQELIPNKHRAFHEVLYQHGYARAFQHSLTPFKSRQLNDTATIAEKIRQRGWL